MTSTWDELRPARARDWEEGDDGHVTLLVPPYGGGRAGRVLQSWLRAPCHQVHLDDVGSFVWRRCDGATPVMDIAAAMQEHFGARVDPVEERLTTFLQQLARGRFVDLDSKTGL
jgi:hypothetical protein